MFKFILSYISYFLIMALMIFCCVINDASLGAKFFLLGFVSLALGTPVAKHTRLGLVDKRYKEQSVVWWQVFVGLILFAIGIFLPS